MKYTEYIEKEGSILNQVGSKSDGYYCQVSLI
jgi:hypothetical protein